MILIAEDEIKLAKLIQLSLSHEKLEASYVTDGLAALRVLQAQSVQVLITDLRMPGLDGMSLLKEVKKNRPETAVLVMTAHGDTRTAVEAMKNGAFEYLQKPFEMDELIILVKSILRQSLLEKENRDLKSQLKQQIKNMVGESAPMQNVFKQIKQVCNRDVTVLIRGASGTGKELVARAIHFEGNRAEGPFVAVNCCAIPENLLENELFGHEKGAFTGADSLKTGKFEQAQGGTIFLDEIGEISPSIQGKLLRVLQEKEIVRIGGTKSLSLNVRVIAATNRELESAVKEKEFREDLYYRLNVFPIFLPSLSERREDIPALISYFLNRFGHPQTALDKEVLEILGRYPWPGNIRELENCLERAVILAEGKNITGTHLPPHIVNNLNLKSGQFALPDEGISMTELEKALIVQALEKSEGNKTKAAQLLGITRRTIYSKMETYKINL